MGVGENRNWLNNSMFNTVFSNICSPYTEQTRSGLPNPTPVEGHVLFFQATGMSSRAQRLRARLTLVIRHLVISR